MIRFVRPPFILGADTQEMAALFLIGFTPIRKKSENPSRPSPALCNSKTISPGRLRGSI